MRALLMLPVACLASCSSPDATGNAVDVEAAAARAEEDIANYAALHQERTSQPPAPPALPQGAPSASGAGRPAARPSPDATPVAEDDARALATRYVAAIADRRYHDAWLLWEGRGAASGMSATAFAAGFARYATYQATVGEPFDADAGAGQRFVTVPITVHARLASGEPIVLHGPLVLHRAAEGIESDDPEDHLWRIRSSGVKVVGKEAAIHP